MDDDTEDLDRSVEMAWIRFQRKLGDRLAQLEDDETTELVLPAGDDDEAGQRIACAAQPAGMLSALVPAEVVARNGAGDSLVDDGWALQGDGDLLLAMPRERVDHMAHLVVRALRNDLGLPHPVFVETDFTETATVVPPADGASDEHYVVPQVDLVAPIMPESHADLVQAVDDTLSQLLGRKVFRDEDGDFPMIYGSVVVFVRPLARAPVVELTCPLIRDVADIEHALVEISILNRRSEFVAYFLDGTTIMARAHVPAFPYVPQHLLGVLNKMSETLDDLDEDLCLRVSGRQWLERPDSGAAGSGEGAGAAGAAGRVEAPDEGGSALEDDDEAGGDELPPQLVALLQYDADGDTAVAPTVVATLFDNDVSLLVECLRMSEQETISWRQSMDEALAEQDEDEANACAQEMRAWDKTVSDLRAGLRFVVNQLTQEEWGT